MLLTSFYRVVLVSDESATPKQARDLLLEIGKLVHSTNDKFSTVVLSELSQPEIAVCNSVGETKSKALAQPETEPKRPDANPNPPATSPEPKDSSATAAQIGWQFMTLEEIEISRTDATKARVLSSAVGTADIPLGFVQAMHSASPPTASTSTNSTAVSLPAYSLMVDMISLADLVVISRGTANSKRAMEAAKIALEQRVACVAIAADGAEKVWLSHLSPAEFEVTGFNCVIRPVYDYEPIVSQTAPKTLPVEQLIQNKIRSTIKAENEESAFRGEAPYLQRNYLLRFIASLWERLVEDASKFDPIEKVESTATPGNDKKTPPEKLELAELLRLRNELESTVSFWRKLLPSPEALGMLLPFVRRATSNLFARNEAKKSSSSLENERPLISKIYRQTSLYRAPISNVASYYQGLHRFFFMTIPLLSFASLLFSACVPLTKSAPEKQLAQPPSATSPASGTTPGTTPGAVAEPPMSRPVLVLRALSLIAFLLAVGFHRIDSILQLQRRAYDYRLASERLRHALIQMLLHKNPIIPNSLYAHYGARDSRHSWLDAQFRESLQQIKTILAAAGLPAEGLHKNFLETPQFRQECTAMIRDDWLKPQINWHRKTALGYSRLQIMFEALTHTILIVAVVGSILSLCIGSADYADLLLIVGTGLTAVIQYITSHAEIGRMADRYAEMRKVLTRIYWNIEDVKDQKLLFAKTEEALKVALDEAIEWRLQLSYRPLKNPG